MALSDVSHRFTFGHIIIFPITARPCSLEAKVIFMSLNHRYTYTLLEKIIRFDYSVKRRVVYDEKMPGGLK